MEQNLNKENFFDVAAEKYPKAFDNFSKFIDAYKEKVDWWKLFNDGAIVCNGVPVRNEDYTHAPKFHDIPFELQVGIIAKWFTTLRYVGRNYFEPQWLFQYGVFPSIYTMDLCFGKLEEILNDPTHKLKSDMHDLQEQDLKNIEEKGQSNNQ